MGNHSAVIAMFCQHKWCRPAIINKKAKDGSTALQCAVYWDNLECVEELDKVEGVNFKSLDDNGDSILDVARKQKSESLKELSAFIVAKYLSCESDIKHLEIPFSLHSLVEKYFDD